MNFTDAPTRSYSVNQQPWPMVDESEYLYSHNNEHDDPAGCFEKYILLVRI